MKRAIAFLSVFLLMAGLVPAVWAKPILTMDRAVMVNDTQVIMEFSEPVAINLNGTNAGPFAAVRLVNNKNFLQKSTDGQDLNLQWTGTLEYVDEKKDRLIFTIGFSRLGADTVAEVYSRQGELAAYRDLYCCMCLEEVPFDVFTPGYNGLIENVTSLDGSRQLCSNTAMRAAGIYVRLEKDYNYSYQPDQVFSVFDQSVSVSVSPGEITPVKEEIKNDPLVTAMILGGSAVLSLALAVIVAVCLKRRKRS